jgi:hypothetical protein
MEVEIGTTMTWTTTVATIGNITETIGTACLVKGRRMALETGTTMTSIPIAATTGNNTETIETACLVTEIQMIGVADISMAPVVEDTMPWFLSPSITLHMCTYKPPAANLI